MRRDSFSFSAGSLAAAVVMTVGLAAIQAFAADPPARGAITEAEVNAAQQASCDELVKIGKVYKDDGDY